MMRREISCLAAAVVIGLCGGLWGDKVFLMSLKGMLKLWEETRKNKYISYIMVKLKGRFKGETGEKCHMVPLVEEIDSGVEVKRWVGIFLEVVVE